MSGRELKHPEISIEDADEGLRVTFRVPGSKFGPVEIVLSPDEAEKFADDLDMALVFGG